MRFSLGKAAKGLVAGGIAAVVASSSFAASNGFTGFSSTGTLDIQLTVVDEVRISNLQDINLGTFSGADSSGTSPACIYRNATGNYQITGIGSGTSNAFELDDGVPGGSAVPYTVSYDDGTAGAQSLSTGIALTGMVGADDSSDTCANTGDNGTVSVTVTSADAASLPAGTYTGTLTLVVAPE